MSGAQQPTEPPPSYNAAISGDPPSGPSSEPTAAAEASSTSSSSTIQQQQQQQQEQGRPSEAHQQERDIEQEDRPLPPGWVPQYNEQYDRFFFVDTLAKPPKSIWEHPMDNQEWLSKVPHGMTPLQYIEKLWQEYPEPTPEPRPRPLPGVGVGVRQGNIQGMQSHYPGTSTMQGGQVSHLQQLVAQGRPITLEDLTQHFLSKMGTPEEYEKKNPPSKASKLFHSKETAAQRQRRHAEHKARDVADALAYRAPTYPPYGSMYAYPGYGRGYNRAYPGLGMSGAFLGLGAGALLGSAMF